VRKVCGAFPRYPSPARDVSNWLVATRFKLRHLTGGR
jgi:hypothetical protein